MRTYLISAEVSLLLMLASACGPAQTPTATQPTAAPTSVPAIEPTDVPAADTVEFVWQVTGDEDPLYWPSGLALDAQGTLYVADTRNHRIQLFDGEGQFLATWGGEGPLEGQFNFVWEDPTHNLPAGGLDFDANGNLIVADMGNVRIQKLDGSGSFLARWGGDGTGDGQFARPFGLAVDGQGNVFVVDDRIFGSGRVQKFDNEGNFLVAFGRGLFGDPGLIEVDALGNVYVADYGRGTVLKFDNDGALLATFGGSGRSDGQSADRRGSVVTATRTSWTPNAQPRSSNSSGEYLLQWGSRGSEEGQFNEPLDIVLDGKGNIYVSDQFNNRVQKFREQ
jgi:DNA-binding beta-propeller fold protein YncE